MDNSNEKMTEIYVVGLGGSLRERSYTRMAVNYALKGAEEFGARTRMLDLREYELSFGEVQDHETKGAKQMRQDIRAAHGIILGTPEYHGGISGVLKHALDLMGFDEFEGKLIGMIGVAGGRLGAINSLNSLRTVGRALHAWVIPEQVSIAEAWKKFDSEGRPKSSEIAKNLKEVGRQVARFALLHNSKQAQVFLHEWEIAQPNPGGYRDLSKKGG